MQNFSLSTIATPLASGRDMVAAAWTNAPPWRALVGHSETFVPTLESTAQWLEFLHKIDISLQVRIRARVDKAAQDPGTAAKLKHGIRRGAKDQLSTMIVFQRSTRQMHISSIPSIEEQEVWREYRFRPHSRSECARCIFGHRTQRSDHATRTGHQRCHSSRRGNPKPSELVYGRAFAVCRVSQPSAHLDIISEHVVCILPTADQKSHSENEDEERKREGISIQPSRKAEETRSYQIMNHTASFTAMTGCTPSYLNAEGDVDNRMAQSFLEGKVNAARRSQGIDGYRQILEKWKGTGGLEGLEVVPATRIAASWQDKFKSSCSVIQHDG